MLLSFSNISTVPHFQRICLLSSWHNFALNSGEEAATYTLFSLHLFLEQPPNWHQFLLIICYLPVDSYYQHKPEADVSHLISVPPFFSLDLPNGKFHRKVEKQWQ
jgi:hypothetical protein